eukprot:GHVR01092296.1.p1 GENE.GHVR01092296.1~~GHVR01092296.1.p1  ORF type:complete len:430 (+),score=148.30 GHVR01092296.1:83-1372(+)
MAAAAAAAILSPAQQPTFSPVQGENRALVLSQLPASLTEDESSHISCGSRVLTLYGPALIKEMRDEVYEVEFTFGVGYLNRQSFKKDVEADILEDIESLKAQGDALAANQDIAGAALAYEKGLRVVPYSKHDLPKVKLALSHVCLACATCHLSQEELDRALQSCLLALRYNENNLKALLCLGQIHSRLGNFKEADYNLRKVIRHPDVHLTSGVCCEAKTELRRNRECSDARATRATSKRASAFREQGYVSQSNNLVHTQTHTHTQSCLSSTHQGTLEEYAPPLTGESPVAGDTSVDEQLCEELRQRKKARTQDYRQEGEGGQGGQDGDGEGIDDNQHRRAMTDFLFGFTCSTNTPAPADGTPGSVGSVSAEEDEERGRSSFLNKSWSARLKAASLVGSKISSMPVVTHATAFVGGMMLVSVIAAVLRRH